MPPYLTDGYPLIVRENVWNLAGVEHVVDVFDEGFVDDLGVRKQERQRRSGEGEGAGGCVRGRAMERSPKSRQNLEDVADPRGRRKELRFIVPLDGKFEERGAVQYHVNHKPYRITRCVYAKQRACIVGTYAPVPAPLRTVFRSSLHSVWPYFLLISI